MLVQDVHPPLASYLIGEPVLHSLSGDLPGRFWPLDHLSYTANHVLLEHPSHCHLLLHQSLMAGMGLVDNLREVISLQVIGEGVCVSVGCDQFGDGLMVNIGEEVIGNLVALHPLLHVPNSLSTTAMRLQQFILLLHHP